MSGAIKTTPESVGLGYSTPSPFRLTFPPPRLILPAQLAGRAPAGAAVGTDVTDTSCPSAAANPEQPHRRLI